MPVFESGHLKGSEGILGETAQADSQPANPPFARHPCPRPIAIEMGHVTSGKR
jgi:hypothetical protein